MLAPSIPLLLALSNLLFSPPTTAAPTRTHCRCTLLDSSQSSTSSSSSSSSRPYSPMTPPQEGESTTYDICASLGPELESFRHTEPTLYETYMNEASIAHSTTSSPSTIEAQNANSNTNTNQGTTVLLGITNRHGFRNLGVLLPSEPRPTERPTSQIVCRSEAEPFSVYQDSFVTLAVLQLIIAITILACVAEGVSMGMRWMHQRYSKTTTTDTTTTTTNPLTPITTNFDPYQKPVLRLLGAERRLLAFSCPPDHQVPSPGVEKKLRVYDSPEWINRSPSSQHQKHEFNAFEDDEDDEMNMPVM